MTNQLLVNGYEVSSLGEDINMVNKITEALLDGKTKMVLKVNTEETVCFVSLSDCNDRIIM